MFYFQFLGINPIDANQTAERLKSEVYHQICETKYIGGDRSDEGLYPAFFTSHVLSFARHADAQLYSGAASP